MPFGGYEDFAACTRDNQDKDNPEAYCAEVKRRTESELSAEEEKALEESDCPEGQVSIDGECVDVESVEAPPSLLSEPRIMASASPLDTQPIEREELGDGKVAYRGLKLIDEGVWTDSNSKTATLYDGRTFENTEPDFDSGKYDGPPTNIAHDIHKDGPNAGEPHEASIGGYIDPDSLATDGTALFGDVILNTNDAAGAFADENLQSALENKGSAGFSPSVELMPTELEEADHPRAEEYVAAAQLTGLGLVRDPASKSVDLAHETRNRAVAMSASGKDAKALYLQERSMADAETYREILEANGVDTGEMTDDEVMAIAESMGEAMDPEANEEEEEERENADEEEADDDEEEEQEMADGDDVVEMLQDQVAELAARLEDLEDSMATEEEMGNSLEEAKAELADAETVEELKETMDKRLSKLEDAPKPSKTLADGATDEEWEPTYDDSPTTPSSW